MRCSSRSGWGEASTASDRGGGSLATAQAIAGPWPVKSRLAVPRSTATRAPFHLPRCVECSRTQVRGMFTDSGSWNVSRTQVRGNGQLRTWATTGVVGGVWTIAQLCSWVVSVAEIDKRRAALGDHWVNSP
jgi:hypothetical protein